MVFTPECPAGAALAYYSLFSLGPLLLIVISVAGLFFGADAVHGSFVAQLKSLLGENGGKAVEAMLVGASSEQSGRSVAFVGTLLLLVAALGVVARSLSTERVSSSRRGYRNYARGRWSDGRGYCRSLERRRSAGTPCRKLRLRLCQPRMVHGLARRLDPTEDCRRRPSAFGYWRNQPGVDGPLCARVTA